MTKHKPYSCSYKLLTTIFLLLFLLFPILVSSSKCTCEQETQKQNPNTSQEALKYKLIAIVSILLSSGLGVSFPFLVQNISYLHPEGDTFSLIKTFAAGVILATGFIHILPDAIESLTSPCLNENPWSKFPFTGFFAMLSAIGTLMMESFASGYHKRSELGKDQHVSGDGSMDFALERTNSSVLIRYRIVSQVLELGIVVHSIIIGLSLGASQNPKTIKPLVAALSFHQFFEGIGLGGCISQAKFKSQAVAIMVIFFSLTTPSGIAIGIGISKSYNEISPTALIFQGILNSASAGILIYMALVDFLASEFMGSKMLSNFRLAQTLLYFLEHSV